MSEKSLSTDEINESSSDFEIMYESNAPLIYRFMFWRTKDKMLSEDLTSNVFEKAWQSRDSFKGGSVKAWLYRIARNTLIDHWRKKQDYLLKESTYDAIPSDEADLGEAFDRTKRIENLERAVAKLPAVMRDIVELRFIHGFSAKQTGQKMGISEVNVRVIQYRALRKLRDYLK